MCQNDSKICLAKKMFLFKKNFNSEHKEKKSKIHTLCTHCKRCSVCFFVNRQCRKSKDEKNFDNHLVCAQCGLCSVCFFEGCRQLNKLQESEASSSGEESCNELQPLLRKKEKKSEGSCFQALIEEVIVTNIPFTGPSDKIVGNLNQKRKY